MIGKRSGGKEGPPERKGEGPEDAGGKAKNQGLFRRKGEGELEDKLGPGKEKERNEDGKRKGPSRRKVFQEEILRGRSEVGGDNV